jgi:Pyridoxamine 5'-phosphate oxidase
VEDAEHAYTPPRSVTRQLPDALLRYLDGGDLLHKTQALRLATVDAAGWPHAALLSAGDVLAVSPQRLRFALFAQSGSAANLARDGRATLALAQDGGLCEVRLHTRRLAPDDGPLALFEGKVDEVRTDVSPYADVTSGIAFALHQPEVVHARWLRQLDALKNAR